MYYLHITHNYNVTFHFLTTLLQWQTSASQRSHPQHKVSVNRTLIIEAWHTFISIPISWTHTTDTCTFILMYKIFLLTYSGELSVNILQLWHFSKLWWTHSLLNEILISTKLENFWCCIFAADYFYDIPILAKDELIIPTIRTPTLLIFSLVLEKNLNEYSFKPCNKHSRFFMAQKYQKVKARALFHRKNKRRANIGTKKTNGSCYQQTNRSSPSNISLSIQQYLIMLIVSIPCAAIHQCVSPHVRHC